MFLTNIVMPRRCLKTGLNKCFSENNVFLKVCYRTLELVAMSPALEEIKGVKGLEKGESNAQKVDTPNSY